MRNLYERVRELTEQELESLGFGVRSLHEGETLFRQGDAASVLYLVKEGRLRLVVDGATLDEVGPGEALGEASVFIPGETRLGDAVALMDCTLLTLDRLQLRHLHQDKEPVYDWLLNGALAETWERLQQKDEEIAAQSGEDLRAPQELGPVARLFDRLLPPPAEPDFYRSLMRVPVLGWTAPARRREVIRFMTPRYVSDGRALFLEGDDEDDSVYVVASGRISIQRRTSPDEVRELTRLEAGSVFGAAAFVAGAPRTAAAVASGPTWVLGLARSKAMHELPVHARRIVLETLLTTMRQQLQAANTLMASLRRPEQQFSALVQAVGHLQGWRAGDPLTEVRIEDLAEPEPVSSPDAECEWLFRVIRESVIGGDVALQTPFGTRRLVYADYTASGRCLSFIEDFLRDQVMPLYANTHTEASASGLQTTRFREEARAQVAASVKAGPDDAVIFVGSGATGAVNRLIDLLGLRKPLPAPGQDEVEDLPPAERPVVFVGPYEHHSNLLPWRHSLADLVMIPLDDRGGIDVAVLGQRLEEFADRPMRIGSFSAGSNVTGVATDVAGITTLLHEHGALSFWDYAAAGPYVPIDMNPSQEGAHKDAIFLSPHKFVGGPGTPGILVMKQALARHGTPTQPGGGTVDFVTGTDSLYSDSLTHREEAGTPAILESIRCGLVFQLKDRVGGYRIHEMEQRLVDGAIAAWTANPTLRILGPSKAARLSIVSFLVRHGRGYLHYNYVVALLNDLFGIQARGGCSCAGPYGATLLGMDEDAGNALLRLASCGQTSIKPGWARVNFNYFIHPDEYAYIVQAVNLVGAYGYALLPRYRFDPGTGLWHHRGEQPYRPVSLGDLSLSPDGATWPERGRERRPASSLDEDLDTGRRILREACRFVPDEVAPVELDVDYERWRWFPLPHEVAAFLRHRNGEGTAEEFVPAYRAS